MYTNIGIIYYKTAIKNIFANRKRKTSTRKYAHIGNGSKQDLLLNSKITEKLRIQNMGSPA